MPDGLYQEIYLHYIVYKNEAGEIIKTKLDKTIKGKLYKIAKDNERSSYGEIEHIFPGTTEPVRLLALAGTYRDRVYGRF
jgi:hypothetical protein